jgi:hypothetical protein
MFGFLDAFIRPRSVRGRCACPSGTTKVFVGGYGIRCGQVRRTRSGRKRFAFVKTPKSCNYVPPKKQRQTDRARVSAGPSF